jgi:four helix bundle protein
MAIKRAAVSVCLNIAEGASRKSVAERKKYFEIASGSIVEIDAVLDIANSFGYLKEYDISKLGETMRRSLKLLSGLINPVAKN